MIADLDGASVGPGWCGLTDLDTDTLTFDTDSKEFATLPEWLSRNMTPAQITLLAEAYHLKGCALTEQESLALLHLN